jgi:hypothetical protein
MNNYSSKSEVEVTSENYEGSPYKEDNPETARGEKMVY